MPENTDSRGFISADEFGIVSDNNKSGKISSENTEIQLSDEWSVSTNNLSGTSDLIDKVSLSTIWDFPVDNVYLDANDNLLFQDDNIITTDDSGCPIDDGIISLAELTGDVDLLKDFDRINTFGKIFDIQFRDITHGQYKYANTQICNIVSTSLGFMSLDKLINDERTRQVRKDALNAEFAGTDDAAYYPPYSGFLVSDSYVNEGWINFDQAIHDRLKDEFGFDDESSVSIKTKKFKDTKRVLVNMAMTYSSSIPILQSNNKITDFGIRIVDRTSGQQLDLSNFKNDMLTEYGNSGVASFSGKLEYILPTDIDEEVICSPCGKYKVIRCEGTIYREESCESSGDLGVSHELAPQFRLNPIIETRINKKDILNTIDPIQWTGGTQDYTEDEWKGITNLRREFGSDNLHVGKFNESRAFHYAAGDFDSGFAVGGFFHGKQIDDNNVEKFTYGSRTSTEIWNGTDWVSTDYTIPSPRSSGLGGGDGVYNVIAYGTKGSYEIDAQTAFVGGDIATPVPSFFVTNYDTSKTEIMDSDASMNWTPADCNTHTNVPRHSVAGVINAVKQFTTLDGKKLESNTITNAAATPFTLSEILGEDIPEEDDIQFNLPNNIFNTLSSFVRDSSRRASGKGVATSLKLIGPAFNADEALLDSKVVPYVQNDDDKIPTGSFSQKTKGAMDFIIKKSDGTSDNYDSGTSIDIPTQVPTGLPSDLVCTAGVTGLDNLASSVESWEHPIRLDDNTIIFVDKSGAVDTDLLKEGQTVDKGDWYEMYNISGIAFNGSTGDLEIVDIDDSDLSDVFEYFSYVKFVHHSTKRKTGTAYDNITFTFENGAFTVDPNRKYPIKTVGTCYVGNEVSGLATGGKTSNQIFGCSENASLNIKYGYFGDARYDEFKNSIVNVSYQLNGDTWIRRDNLPENVAFHAGVGDETHALFWGGLHGSLELPDVVASFPGCDDWSKAIKSFGGVFNIRGNKGLDSEDRYSFFSTRFVDEFGNSYYKAGDYRYDLNQYGVDYSAEYLEDYDSQITHKWSEDLDRSHGHIYSATYPTSADDMFVINYYVNGQSWIGDLSFAEKITDIEGIASREHSDQIGTWLKEFMDNDLYHEYFSSYRPDTDDNSLNGGNVSVNADGIYPTRFNYFLNDFEDRTLVWKYSGHPVNGPMWIWSRPTPGEELFDPRSIHAAPTESGEWQSESIFDKHSFKEHIGYESFFTKLDQEYDDLLDDTSFATKIVKDQIKTVYWVMDVYDADSQETFSTLYDYDIDKIEQFYEDFEDYTDSGVAWQHFLAREAGRVRLRSEDTRYRIEYISDLEWLEDGPLTIIKQGTVPVPTGDIKIARVSFIQRLPEFLNEATTYDVRTVDENGNLISFLSSVEKTPTGFTILFPNDDTIIPTVNWKIVIDIRQDFIEMYHHGINKNMNQNHGIPLSALAKEFRAYFEDQDTVEVNLFTVAHMQNLLDVNYRLGNIDITKLVPPFTSHVPEEALTVPVSSSKFAPTPLDVTIYQDVFTHPDKLPPYDQLVLHDHYPTSPITSMEWALSRYKTLGFYDSEGNPIVKKVLSYVKTDTENPKTFRYVDSLTSVLDSDTSRSIYSPKTFEKFIDEFTPNIDDSGLTRNVYSRYVEKYFPDAILSTKLTGSQSTYAPVDEESSANRWDLINAASTVIYNPSNSVTGKLLSNNILYKETTLDCTFDTSLLTSLTAQVTGNNTFININDITGPLVGDEKFYVVNGSNITLFGKDELDNLEESYHAFYFDTANEVISSPAVYSAALLANPCLALTPPVDTENFRLYHSILESGIYKGLHAPSTWIRTNASPLFYPDWMDSSGIIWSTTNNPSSILTPQNYPLSTIDTTRKTVFTTSNLIGQTWSFPDLPELGVGDREVFVANMFRTDIGDITVEEVSANTPIESSRVQLFRTSHDLINLLNKGNKLDIFGGLFDVFHHNNITRKSDYGITPYDNPEPRLRGIPTTSFTNNSDFYEEWNYSWNTDYSDTDIVGTESISGGGVYTGDIDDVPTTYKQDLVRNYTFDVPTSAAIAALTAPYDLVISYSGPGNTTVSNLTSAGFTLTIADWYPLVEEVFTTMGMTIIVTLEEIARNFSWYVQVVQSAFPDMVEIDPFNQSAVDNIYYSTAIESNPADTEFRHEKIRALYDDNHWPDGYASKNFTIVANDVIYDTENSNIAFAYHYGFERAFIDPLADTEGSNMSVAYDYYRYRFLNIEEDISNWLYVPYSEEISNNVFDVNNLATSEVTPEFMTYSFYIDRSCDGLDQLIYGKDNNTFVERWKYPHVNEVLNNLTVTKEIDNIDTLVTLTNNGSGGYVDIQEYEIFKNGSLSVGKFTYPSINNDLIVDGVENPLKSVIQKIATTSCQGITGAGVDWNELFTFLDSDNDIDGKYNCYFPLSYDPYAGNSTFLPELPYFKEENTQFRFDNTKVSSTIRDRAALWPWCDLLKGSSLNKPVIGDYTWQFTTDNKFWLAEVIDITENEGNDPLERTVTNNVYGDDTIGREVYRIRGYEHNGKLFFDYTLTYDEHAGPELEITPQVASDFNMFGQELKTKTIELDHFNTRPVNGPTQIDFLNENEDVWHATQWNHFSVDLPKDLYRYRQRDLCELITDSFNKGTVPDNGKLCKIQDVSQVWIYSVPYDSLSLPGTPVNSSFWIEENPLAVTAFTSGSTSGYYDMSNNIVENIITVNTVNTSANPIGSQIVYKTAYTRTAGTNALRYSRALISGPTSHGLGMFDFGKSQGYGGSLLHYGDREYVKYSVTDNTSVVPSYDTLKQSWPWNVIGNDGELGPKSFTDTVDISGNYWFAFGDSDNLEDIENAQSSDVDFKATYIIGMIAKAKLDDFKVALMDTNYIRSNDTLNLLKLSEQNPDYVEFSLLDAQNFGARLREGFLEVVNSMNGEDFFELFVYLIDENVINVDEVGNETEKSVSLATTTENISGFGVLPLPPLELGSNPPEIVQDLIMVSSEDPTCLLCEVCDELTTNYQDLENPSVWTQHNHDEWVAPWLESPFSGPYHSDGFNVWLTAGTANKWGTQVWAKLENGKVWLSYKRQRIHADKVRGHVSLQTITGTISMEDFSTIEAQNLNIPVYCTYDEFLFNYDDYAELDVIKKLSGDIDGTVYRYGIDCEDSFTVYNPISFGTSPVSSCSFDPSGCLTEGISGTFICPDLTPNEVYTEWSTSFIQEYKERSRIVGTDLIGKYFFKYDVNNTHDTNTFLTPESITDKEIVEYDWRRYQDGVGIGGSAPLINLLSDEDVRCITLRECHIGQRAFGTTDKAILSGGFAVPADGEVSLADGWWRRFTTSATAKWNTSVISPEDSLNENYRHRSLSPFFSNGVQTNSRLSLGYIMFDLGKEALVERQGIANFNQQKSVQVTFVDEIPDFFANNDKYSIVLQPDQNVKTWWANKTSTGFTINVELESWTGNVDWQVTLIDSIPPEEIDGIKDDETFDKWDDL